ncbi:MAG: chloride channel protein [Candidatus Nanopelagicales bacterium]
MPQGPAAVPVAPSPGKLTALTLMAVAVGLVAGMGASLFVKVEHMLQHWLWHSLPMRLGQEHAPNWLVIALLVAGALIVYLATKLPGHGGHSPLDGFGVDIGPREVTSVVIAALGSLAFGAVLGPEAPLMAVGTALGALAFGRMGGQVRQVMMVAGAMAAIGSIFGNPLISAILLLEFAMAGGAIANMAVMLPALASLASSYVLQVGFADWSGIGEAQLGLPGLAAYPEVQTVDVAASVPVAVVVAVVAIAARLLAERVAAQAKRSPLPTLVGAAVIVAVSAVVVAEVTGGDLGLVLFSGQSAMPDYLALASIGPALVILIGKFIAYAASLGSGFRGGLVFPAVALGAILASITGLLLDGTSVPALAAASIAAATVGGTRLPFMALTLAVILTIPAGGATTVLAVIGTLVGMLTRLVAEQRLPSLVPHRH